MLTNQTCSPEVLAIMRPIVMDLVPIYNMDKNKSVVNNRPDPYPVKMIKARCVHRLPVGDILKRHIVPMKDNKYRCDICGAEIAIVFDEATLIDPIKAALPAINALVSFGPDYNIPPDAFQDCIIAKEALRKVVHSMAQFIAIVNADENSYRNERMIGEEYADKSMNTIIQY